MCLACLFVRLLAVVSGRARPCGLANGPSCALLDESIVCCSRACSSCPVELPCMAAFVTTWTLSSLCSLTLRWQHCAGIVCQNQHAVCISLSVTAATHHNRATGLEDREIRGTPSVLIVCLEQHWVCRTWLLQQLLRVHCVRLFAGPCRYRCHISVGGLLRPAYGLACILSFLLSSLPAGGVGTCVLLLGRVDPPLVELLLTL